jgi:prophage tail gpP-like protein
LKLIAFARLWKMVAQEEVEIVGKLEFNADVLKIETWQTEEPFHRFSDPICISNDISDGNLVANAAQWNFRHRTAPDVLIIPPLKDTVFLRNGHIWKMQFSIQFKSNGSKAVGLTFMKNLGTRGDAQGTVPVIMFHNDDAFTEEWTLEVTLQMPGSHAMALVGWKEPVTDPTTACQLGMNWEVVS